MNMPMNVEQARAFLSRVFPQNTCIVESIGEGTSVLRQKIGHEHLRPGGTVSGPTLMSVADCAAYVAILGKAGEVALAVTTSLNINFLRKPSSDRDIIGKCRLLKAGKRLMVCEISLFSEGLPEPVAHVTATYSIPPNLSQHS